MIRFRLDRLLSQILARATRIPVTNAVENQTIAPGRVYIARSDLHLTVSPQKHFSYVSGTRIKHVRSSANPLFESAAAAFNRQLIAVVLTGYGSDGTDGVQTVKAHGGIVIAQDPLTAEHGSMSQSAVKTGAVDLVLPLAANGPAITDIVCGQPARNASPAR